MTAATATTWPSIRRSPKGGIHARVARAVFEQAVARVPVRVAFPDGRSIGGGGPHAPGMRIVRPASFFARLGHDTMIGFGEAYMAGDWTADAGTDLGELLTPFAARLTSLVPQSLQRLRAVVDKRLPAHTVNTMDGSKDNISAHYDLSNELFEAFLDPSLSYSSAWFEEADLDAQAGDCGGRTPDLGSAQLRKIDGILDQAGVRQGTRLLEIGSGWGALAIRAAERGASVRSITLSQEQLDVAEKRVGEAGLGDRVEFRLQDYREVTGQFDAIVSVEMIEAVGAEFWPTYFGSIDALLAPGGRVSIQAITMSHERMLATRRSWGWIQKYIFPGGLIPSLTAIDETLAEHTTLRVSARRELGWHYAETLRQWRERFLENWPHINGLGFDETFRRMWEFYLAYCQAGFATGYLGVSQLQIARPPAVLR